MGHTFMEDPASRDMVVQSRFSQVERAATQTEMVRRAIEIVAERIADAFMEAHGQEILAALDPQAVANLAIADSGRAVREALEKQVPREVQHHHHHEREFYKVGLFGGVGRVR